MNAPDVHVLEFAYDHGMVVVTHDLDYGALLAASGGTGPSVVILRTQSASTDAVMQLLATVLANHAPALQTGVLIVIDEARSRVRILPI